MPKRPSFVGRLEQCSLNHGEKRIDGAIGAAEVTITTMTCIVFVVTLTSS
jgi:hypothetical protein